MDKFNIAEYIAIVKNGLVSCRSQGPAGILLLEQIGNLLSPIIYFDDTKISRLSKHLNNVPNEVINAVSDPSKVAGVISGFKSNVASDFNSATIDNVCLNLIRLISSEPNLASSYKTVLNDSYNTGDNATFLALALVHVVGMENTNDSKTTTTDEVPYLTEANSHCPNCGKSLFRTVRGRRVSDYGISKIYDETFDDAIKKELEAEYPAPSLLDSIGNKIVLCTTCFSDYRIDPTADKYSKLYEKKRDFERNLEINSELYSIDIENELYNIVKDLGEFNQDKESGLIPLDPSELIEKIPDDVLLKDDVTKWVLRYYKYIEKQFSDLDATGISRFKVIASEVSLAYETLDAIGTLTQKEIFNRLSMWMADQLSYPRDKISVVNIIVAFFVQNCEVFHAIS